MNRDDLVPLTSAPRAVSKLGGSVMITVPPLFFTMAKLDRSRPMQVELFFDGDNLVAKFEELPEKKVELDKEDVV